MFAWRTAIIIGVVVAIVGAAYWIMQGSGLQTMDRAGAVMLVALGAAMAFTFTILFRGSREL